MERNSEYARCVIRVQVNLSNCGQRRSCTGSIVLVCILTLPFIAWSWSIHHTEVNECETAHTTPLAFLYSLVCIDSDVSVGERESSGLNDGDEFIGAAVPMNGSACVQCTLALRDIYPVPVCVGLWIGKFALSILSVQVCVCELALSLTWEFVFWRGWVPTEQHQQNTIWQSAFHHLLTFDFIIFYSYSNLTNVLPLTTAACPYLNLVLI